MFPFSAVVGQAELKRALILTAIDPLIGGVLVRGEKGTAKTTTVRAFAEILTAAWRTENPQGNSESGEVSSTNNNRRPPRLVNLPLGATEDRVVGSIDVETVLTQGRATYKPGLLADAHGGVLYVDEINLLADNLVDVVLDAAATGQVTIERDGVSHTAAASFVLVGTMNPEEGELRPQLLDRLGLAVTVAASRDIPTRTDVMRRRLAYDRDPVAFARQWSGQDSTIASRIATARALLPTLVLSDAMVGRIASLCARFDVDGMRADIVLARTALAHAAWSGRSSVTNEDILAAARLALPHRKRRDPFDAPGLDEQQLKEALEAATRDFPDEYDPELDAAANAPQTNPGDGAGSLDEADAHDSASEASDAETADAHDDAANDSAASTTREEQSGNSENGRSRDAASAHQNYQQDTSLFDDLDFSSNPGPSLESLDSAAQDTPPAGPEDSPCSDPNQPQLPGFDRADSLLDDRGDQPASTGVDAQGGSAALGATFRDTPHHPGSGE